MSRQTNTTGRRYDTGNRYDTGRRYNRAGDHHYSGNTSSGYHRTGYANVNRNSTRRLNAPGNPEEGFQYYYGTEAPDLYRYPDIPDLPDERRQAGRKPAPKDHSASRRQDSRGVAQTRTAGSTKERERIQQQVAVQHVSPLAVLLVAGVVAVMSLFLIQYLHLQTEVTNASQEVASLQSTYSKLKQSNDEAQNKLDNSINLDEIKYKAMTELGMTYPDEDQMITYTNDDSDYVHQVQEVK